MNDLPEESYLVLTRNSSQRILIGESIIIKVMDIYRNQVRIGIYAPKDILIWREEVWLRQQQKSGDPP